MKNTTFLLASGAWCAVVYGCVYALLQPYVPAKAEPVSVETVQVQNESVREKAQVESISVGTFVVRTEGGEQYRIDSAYGRGFHVGDSVTIVYAPSAKTQDGDCFYVSPTSVDVCDDADLVFTD